MPAKTIYFRDIQVYKDLQRAAAHQHIAVSQLIEKLCMDFLEEFEPPDTCPTCGHIIVEPKDA